MKIGIISPNFLEPHAWMASAYKTAHILKQEGYTVSVLTTQTKESKRYERISGIPVYRVPCFMLPDPINVAIPFGFFFSLYRFIRRESCDTYIVNKHMFITSWGVLLLRLMGKQVILQTDTFPGVNWFTRNAFVNSILWLYARTIGWCILKLSSQVVVLYSQLQHVGRKLLLKKIHVIHNGVDSEFFDQQQPAKDILALKKNKTLITFIGRLDAVKGYDTLLQVVQQFSTKKNIHFLFVCGNKHKELQKTLQKKHRNATFLGFRKDIASILKASDIYVLPSYNEGLPNTLMEAMSCKIPCIASRVGGVSDLITDKKNGLLIKRQEPKALGQALQKLIDNSHLREIYGKAGYERIQKAFSFTHIRKGWKHLLEQGGNK